MIKLLHADASNDNPPNCAQLLQAKAAEIEGLLQRLSDVNDEMGSVIGGGSDARSHTLARHRDVLQEYTQVRVSCFKGKHTLRNVACLL